MLVNLTGAFLNFPMTNEQCMVPSGYFTLGRRAIVRTQKRRKRCGTAFDIRRFLFPAGSSFVGYADLIVRVAEHSTTSICLESGRPVVRPNSLWPPTNPVLAISLLELLAPQTSKDEQGTHGG